MQVLVLKLSPLLGVTSSMMRTIGLVKGLDDLGYQIDFLTTPASHQQIAYRKSIVEFSANVRLLETKPNALYSSLVSSQKSRAKRLLISIVRKVYYFFSIYDHSLQISRNINPELLRTHYDLVISVSDPKTSHLAVLNLKKKGVLFDKWISYWGDPMTLDITNKSKMPRFVYKYQERRMIAASDNVVYTNPFTVRAQQQLFPEFAEKMIYSPSPISSEMKCQNMSDDKFVVSYIGAYHSRVRNILPFYHACAMLGERAQTNIVGDSDLSLQQTKTISILPRAEVKEIECATDLFVCILNNSGTQIPGKVYHYAASNRPILVILDGENKHIIREYLNSFNRYIFCDNVAEQIADAIRGIMNDNRIWSPCEQMLPINVANRILSSLEIGRGC